MVSHEDLWLIATNINPSGSVPAQDGAVTVTYEEEVKVLPRVRRSNLVPTPPRTEALGNPELLKTWPFDVLAQPVPLEKASSLKASCQARAMECERQIIVVSWSSYEHTRKGASRAFGFVSIMRQSFKASSAPDPDSAFDFSSQVVSEVHPTASPKK
ncbi:hypothetical protein L1987_19382 [Smallanthus sonchifolius]|uniref:Uncharacterized protein n=1 Tax=Smallanthus sonchifolius TaxID=185202 RepID=A0ACB9INY1_9ASTR|nr:hypothetical protein L1987_19382 [Smallanthus sonchifolius]